MLESVTYQLLLDEGCQKTARNIAVNLLKEGLSIDLIVKTTGLTIEEVQQLQSNQTENQTE